MVKRSSARQRFALKLAVLERDTTMPVCYFCKRPMTWTGPDNPRSATLEHLVPLRYGGKDDLSNAAFSCKKCNNDRNEVL